MHRLRSWGLGVVLTVAVALPIGAADEDLTTTPQTQSWWSRLFNRPPPKDELTELVNAQDAKADQQLAAIREREEREKAEALRARDRYLRQERVLDRIQELALEAGDQDLHARIEALRERAWAVCAKRSKPSTIEIRKVGGRQTGGAKQESPSRGEVEP